jgi:DnaJ family protein C protein 8
MNKMSMIAEGAEAKRKEDEIAAKKRKADAEKNWEGNSFVPCDQLDVRADCFYLSPETREERVGDWRAFQKGGKKKAKIPKLLG